MRRALSNTIGFDDAPFAFAHRGDVPLVGAVFAGTRLDGLVIGKVRRDGANATREMTRLILESKFGPQLQLVLLQGVAVAGFNVVAAHALHHATGLPVLVVARHRPHPEKVRRALLARVRGGARKWRLIEALGPAENIGGVFAQRVGLTADEAARVIARLAIAGHLPEPLRVAHLVAGALATGESRGRV